MSAVNKDNPPEKVKTKKAPKTKGAQKKEQTKSKSKSKSKENRKRRLELRDKAFKEAVANDWFFNDTIPAKSFEDNWDEAMKSATDNFRKLDETAIAERKTMLEEMAKRREDAIAGLTKTDAVTEADVTKAVEEDVAAQADPEKPIISYDDESRNGEAPTETVTAEEKTDDETPQTPEPAVERQEEQEPEVQGSTENGSAPDATEQPGTPGEEVAVLLDEEAKAAASVGKMKKKTLGKGIKMAETVRDLAHLIVNGPEWPSNDNTLSEETIAKDIATEEAHREENADNAPGIAVGEGVTYGESKVTKQPDMFQEAGATTEVANVAEVDPALEDEVKVDPALEDGRTMTEHGEEADEAEKAEKVDEPAADTATEEPAQQDEPKEAETTEPAPADEAETDKPAGDNEQVTNGAVSVADLESNKPADDVVKAEAPKPEAPKIVVDNTKSDDEVKKALELREAAHKFYGKHFTAERAEKLTLAYKLLMSAVDGQATNNDTKYRLAFKGALAAERAAFKWAGNGDLAVEQQRLAA